MTIFKVMLVGNRVPPNIQRTLDHHGIAWKEITMSNLIEFLKNKDDQALLGSLDYLEPLGGYIFNKPVKIPKQKEVTLFKSANASDIVIKLKSSELYSSFRTILNIKSHNEELARRIILNNQGKINHEHLLKILMLVDHPYPYKSNGKIIDGPWFGRLINSNTKYLLKEDPVKVNKWFDIALDAKLKDENRIDLLRSNAYLIKGLNIGFITLILYLLNKETHQIWFKGLHDGLRLILPDLENFNGKSSQYSIFNKEALAFAKYYGFENTELDWVFSVGLRSALAEKSKIF